MQCRSYFLLVDIDSVPAAQTPRASIINAAIDCRELSCGGEIGDAILYPVHRCLGVVRDHVTDSLHVGCLMPRRSYFFPLVCFYVYRPVLARTAGACNSSDYGGHR